MVHWDCCIHRNYSMSRDKKIGGVITRKLVVLINSHWYVFVNMGKVNKMQDKITSLL